MYCNPLRWSAGRWASTHATVSSILQVYKHKPKKHYQRKTGHRQPLTKFLVTKISPATAEA